MIYLETIERRNFNPKISGAKKKYFIRDLVCVELQVKEHIGKACSGVEIITKDNREIET